MALYVSIIILLIAILVPSASSLAEDIPYYLQLFSDKATREEIEKANWRVRGCLKMECRAVQDIFKAFRYTDVRDLPNTMSRTKPLADIEAVTNRELQKTLIAHYDRYPFYCSILEELARHYSEWSIGHISIELANRIDGQNDKCTSQVIRSFPVNQETTDLINAARESCEAAGYSGCQRDVRP